MSVGPSPQPVARFGTGSSGDLDFSDHFRDAVLREDQCPGVEVVVVARPAAELKFGRQARILILKLMDSIMAPFGKPIRVFHRCGQRWRSFQLRILALCAGSNAWLRR